MKSHENWLAFAQRDLDFAAIALEKRYLSHCCFLSHQCAEKALKAFLVSKKLDYPKSHHLPYLLSLCAQTDKRANALIKPCEFLNRFYMPTRYPDFGVRRPKDAQPSQKRAVRARDEATKALKFIKEIIKK